MFCHGSDIDMTSHVPIVLSLGIIAHNLLRILSGPGSSLRQFNQISTFSLSNTSSDKSAKKKNCLHNERRGGRSVLQGLHSELSP